MLVGIILGTCLEGSILEVGGGVGWNPWFLLVAFQFWSMEARRRTFKLEEAYGNGIPYYPSFLSWQLEGLKVL